MPNETVTIYDYLANPHNEVKNALENLIRGHTPIDEIKTRTVRGGKKARYVSTYFMTRQVSLLTGLRWSSECLEEKYIPNEQNPREIGAKMRVTIYDNDGNKFHQESWGQSDVKKYVKDMVSERGTLIAKAGEPMSVIDDIKAAYSDGIKKCLSYFGIANDVYGGKDPDYFGVETQDAVNGEQLSLNMPQDQAKSLFSQMLSDKKILVSRACELLQINSLTEIDDYYLAGQKLQQLNKGI